MKFTVIIPARYDSSRLPGKPLLDIVGKPMIQHVYERAKHSGAEAVYVATDDQRVADTVSAFGGKSIMTSTHCASGTERLSEAAKNIGLPDDSIVVNLQGDEPMMDSACIHQVAYALNAHHDASVATLCEAITTADSIFDPNIVKVVRDKNDYALYFSRAPIPWSRQRFKQWKKGLNEPSKPKLAHYWRHVGLYAYRTRFVHDYVQCTPCTLEEAESLEQLRVLYHGQRIIVETARAETGLGVDTEKDLLNARKIMSEIKK